jgi:DNA-binding IclR family transcriptional regulator
MFAHKELVLFVIKNSSNGLKFNSIVLRSGLPVAEVKYILTDLNENNIISTIRNKYQFKK